MPTAPNDPSTDESPELVQLHPGQASLFRAGHRYRITCKSDRIVQLAWSDEDASVGDEVRLSARLRGPLPAKLWFHLYEVGKEEPLEALEATPTGRVVEIPWTVEPVGGPTIPEIGDEPGPRPAGDRKAPGAGADKPLELEFEVVLGQEKTRSEPLEVKNRVHLDLDPAETGSSLSGMPWMLIFADGTIHRGTIDDGGALTQEDCPPGAYTAALADASFEAPLSWSLEALPPAAD